MITSGLGYFLLVMQVCAVVIRNSLNIFFTKLPDWNFTRFLRLPKGRHTKSVECVPLMSLGVLWDEPDPGHGTFQRCPEC
jgi:hypothetical protein